MTEAVQFFDGKLYGATQVMDEGRHVEVFNRYLDTKLNKLYQVNDNLFVIIDSLMTDGRWDMKFLGMQIMVEGLALGAFGTLYRRPRSRCSRSSSRWSSRTRRGTCTTASARSASTSTTTSPSGSARSARTGRSRSACSCATG